MKKFPKEKWLDRIHRGWVYTCMGISLFATVNLVVLGYDYIRNVRPKRQAAIEQRKQEFLEEGTALDDAPNLS